MPLWNTWEICFINPEYPLYRNQSIHLHSKPIDWFLYEEKRGHEWVKNKIKRVEFLDIKKTSNWHENIL